MSNFYCEKCNMAILEGIDGRYITGCEHYPLKEEVMRCKIIDISINDAYYKHYNLLINKKGTMKRMYDWGDGWVSGHFYPAWNRLEKALYNADKYNKDFHLSFHEVKVKPIK